MEESREALLALKCHYSFYIPCLPHNYELRQWNHLYHFEVSEVEHFSVKLPEFIENYTFFFFTTAHLADRF